MKLFFHFFALLGTINLFAQPNLELVTPPQPEVASLAKYVVTPVSTYTGMASTTIPLFTVRSGNFELPVSLSYHHGGIMVSEEASSVGLGWALNAGGMITRVVNGHDDFDLEHRKTGPDFPSPLTLRGGRVSPIPGGTNCEYSKNGGITVLSVSEARNEGGLGNIPDIFHYNFSGYSGSFMLDHTNNYKPIQLKKDGLIIKEASDRQVIIITPDGTKYTFSARIRPIPQFTSGITLPEQIHTSSWYLSNIITALGREITFTYQRPQKKVTPIPTYAQNLYLGGQRLRNLSGTIVEHDLLLIHSIESEYQNIAFEYSLEGERKDLGNSYFLRSVTNNVLRDGTGPSDKIEVDRFSFSYSYFGETNRSTQNLTINNGDYRDIAWQYSSLGLVPKSDVELRLRLDGITKNNNESHTFEYYYDRLAHPTKTSLSQDYWGYYNGVRNEGMFIPLIPTSLLGQPAAIRTPSTRHARIFSLRKITYPTKGYKEFDYELHTYSNTLGSGYVSTVYKNLVREDFEEDENGQLQADLEIDQQIFVPFVSGDSDRESQQGIYSSSTNNEEFELSGDQSTTFRIEPGIDNPNGLQEITLQYTLNLVNAREDRDIDDANISAWVSNEAGETVVNRIYLNSNIGSLPGQSRPTYVEGVPYVSRFFSIRVNLPPGTYNLNTNASGSRLKGYASLKIVNPPVNVYRYDSTINTRQKKQYGGGLRIKSISEFDADGRKQLETEYRYEKEQQINERDNESYGKLFSLPRYWVTMEAFKFPFYTDLSNNSEVFVGLGEFDLIFSSTSQTMLNRDFGSFVGYSKVIEIKKDLHSNQTLTTEYNYHNISSFEEVEGIPSISVTNIKGRDRAFHFPDLTYPTNGLLYNQTEYKSAFANASLSKVRQVEYNYNVNGIEVTFDNRHSNADVLYSAESVPAWNLWFVYAALSKDGGRLFTSCREGFHAVDYRPYFSHTIVPATTREIVYGNDGNQTLSTSSYRYDNPIHLQPTAMEVENSDKHKRTERYWYPDDIEATTLLGNKTLLPESFTAVETLKHSGEQPRVGQPIYRETIENGKSQSTRTDFGNFSGNILTQSVLTAKQDEDLEERIAYISYDAKGNLLEAKRSDGSHTIMIWGYHKQYPIARIENASYTGMPEALKSQLEAIATQSDTEVSTPQEDALREALNGLRDHPYFAEALVTTFTYDPLVGVTSQTDPRGYTMQYHYDAFNRLEFVTDQNGDIVSENQYNYKQ